MFKVLILMAAFGGCTLLGFRSANNLRLRHETVQALMVSSRQLAMLMDYTAQPLDVLAQKLARGTTVRFWSLFAKALHNSDNVLNAWRTAMEQARSSDVGFAHLEQEELQILEDFAASLGTTDRKTQRSNVKLLQKRLDDVLEQTQEIYQRKGRMYRSMGVLCGLAAAILLW